MVDQPVPRWPTPVWLAALRVRKDGHSRRSWERLAHRFRVVSQMGLQLPSNCGFVFDLAKHAALSTEPDHYNESYDQVVALALVRPVLDGISPLTRLNPERKFLA